MQIKTPTRPKRLEGTRPECTQGSNNAMRHAALYETFLPRSRHCLIAILLTLAACGLAPGFGPAAASAEDGGTLRVMTQNMYMGTLLGEVRAAQTPAQFVAAITTTYQHILATRPAERVAVIAREIAEHQPDLVGLQQASIVRTGSGPPATAVSFDFVDILLAELAKRGESYSVVAVAPGLDGEAPTTLGLDLRLTTRDVLIARTTAGLELSNLQIRQYIAYPTEQTPFGPFSDPSGFGAIDVVMRGHKFRFITTHFDVRPALSYLQALELVQTAANTALPVVLVCDCNATPDVPTHPTFPTYALIKEAGFSDAFRTAHPNDPGFTAGQAENLLNPTSSLTGRIDLVSFRGPFAVKDAQVVGANPADRTPSGLWPSDHAGVVATLTLPAGKADGD
jgi:endonuclease/exonuclease/phosphatase family metal-dependent hydrolase